MSPRTPDSQLSAYLEGDLSPRQRRRIEAALSASPELRRELRELEAMLATLRGLPSPAPPPALAARVIARVRAGEAEPSTWRNASSWLGRLLEPAVALPAAVGVLGLAVFLGSQQAEPGPSAQQLAAARATAGPQLAGSEPKVRSAATLGERFRSELAERRRAQIAHLVSDLVRQREHAEAARVLRGAGHPHSDWMASSHFDDGIALASAGGRRRGR